MILLILIFALLFSLLTQWFFQLTKLWSGEKSFAAWARPVLKRTAWLLVWAAALLVGTNFDFFAPFRFSWLKLLVAAAGMDLACALELLIKFRRSRKHRPQRFALMLVMLLLISLGLEFFLFNARSIQSYYYEPVELMASVQSAAHNGSYDESTNIYSFLSDDPGITVTPRLMLTLRDMEVDIQNLYLDVRAALGDEYADSVTVSLAMDDDGTSQLFTTPSRDIFPSVERSKYIPIQSVGVSHKLTVTLTGDFDRLQLLSITANAPQPLQFSFGRVLVCLLIGLFIYYCRPSSALYAIALKPGDRRQNLIALAVAIALAIGFASLSLNFQREDDPTVLNYRTVLQHQEYQKLARQLAEGKTWLPDEPPAYLSEMENPYDLPQRQLLEATTGEAFAWDTVFFNGRYYVYFGVAPVILMYLPYYLLTGADLSNLTAAALMAVLFVAALFVLVKKMMLRYAGGGSFLSWLLLSTMICFGSGLIILVNYPGIYTVPILSAMAFSASGLALWYSALEKDGLSAWKLALGSLCMALVAGCRPQMLLFSFLALPLFWDEVFKKRSLLALKKKPLIRTLCFALPYVAVAAGLMYYNFIRFGSPFDFGANYNLTTNDMTVRGFNWERCGTAIFNYLLQLPLYSSAYPFLEASGFNTGYMGVNIFEPTYGGVFFAQPFVLLSLLLYRNRKPLRHNRGFAAGILLFVSGIIVAITDAQMAGILHRYFADFTLMFYLAALILFAVLYRQGDSKQKKLLNTILFACTVLAVYRAFCISCLYLPESFIRSCEFWL